MHPDPFIQVQGKYYGLPAAYSGSRVEVRLTESLVSMYRVTKLIRQYPIRPQRRHYLPKDFPP